MNEHLWGNSRKSKNTDNRDDEDNGFAQWGGYMQAKRAKLEAQYQETTDKEVVQISDIFKNVAIFVNGLTNPSSIELKQIMAENGGVYHLYQNTTTTHIIASNLPNVKINKLGSTPIVKPSWITDCLSFGKLVDHGRYLLYTNQTTTQPKLQFPTKTASDPSFLSEFYTNSRLHLIATLGAEFKQLITNLRHDKSHKCDAFLQLPQTANPRSLSPTKVIMHIDMDCFFVSVARKLRPELAHLPIAVTHARSAHIKSTPARSDALAGSLERYPTKLDRIDANSSLSEIACASYEARKFGVRNGMFLGAAIKLCPDLRPVPYDFDAYRQVAKVLYETLAGYTLQIEAVSCDEMYVDCSALLRATGWSVGEWAAHIRAAIARRTGCPCSAGFGANRLRARLATRRAKPAGWRHLQPGDVARFMAGVGLGELPGVGGATLAKLTALGLATCGDLKRAPVAVLRRELGAKPTAHLLEQANGDDSSELVFEHERKSVSAEVNYGIRFKTQPEADRFLKQLAFEAAKRLDEVKMAARCVTLKVMVRDRAAPAETAKFLGHGVCEAMSKSASCNWPIRSGESVWKEAKTLFGRFKVDFVDLRGLGVQLSKLEKLNNSNLNDFLRHSSNTPKIANCFKEVKSSLPIAKQQIDYKVLNELPPEIRAEVIKEYNLGEELQVDSLKPVEIVKQKSVFDGLNWQQLKPVLYEWLKSDRTPNRFDVDMLADYMQNLAEKRQLEYLKTATSFLHRMVADLGCEWHRGYYLVVEGMQKGMVARYGCVLRVADLDCCFCTKYDVDLV